MKQKHQSYELPFVFEVVVFWNNKSYSVELNRPKTGKYKVDYYATCDNPNCIFMKKRYHGDFECIFKKAGIYKIALHGSFPGFLFRDLVIKGFPAICREMVQARMTYEEILAEDELYYVYYLSKIICWGTNVWQKMDDMFFCEFLSIPAVDAPDLSHVNSLNGMFHGCTTFNNPIEHWDVSNITSMWQTFSHCAHFNQPLNGWDVSNVTQMGQMFCFACSFNQPLNGWDVSHVEGMEHMFSSAISFNQPLDRWNVSHVQDMWGMFEEAVEFNQPLDSWQASSVEERECRYLGSGGLRDNLEMVAINGRIVRQPTDDRYRP